MKSRMMTAAMGCLLAGNCLAGTIIVGTEATFAPFEFKDTKTEEITGFDIDVIKAIAKMNGDTVVVRNMGFDALIPSLMTKQIDVAAAAISITPERLQRVSFTQPYYNSSVVILIRQADKNKIVDLKSLENKRICAQIGTTGAELATSVKGSVVTQFNSVVEAYMELKNLGCEAVLNDQQVVENYLKDGHDKSVVMLSQRYEPSVYGFAVKKDNEAMLDKLNRGLHQLRQSGEYDRIHQKWFGQL